MAVSQGHDLIGILPHRLSVAKFLPARDVVLAEQAAGIFGEEAQHGKGARAQLHTLPFRGPQLVRGQVSGASLIGSVSRHLLSARGGCTLTHNRYRTNGRLAAER